MLVAWAQLGKEPDRPLTELHIAIAGPWVSLRLWAIFGVLSAGIQGVSIGAYNVTHWLNRINLNLALFNLLPGFPLDGGRIFRALVWQHTGDFARATRVAGDIGLGGAYLFIMTGAVIALRGALFEGLWISFTGWFLLLAAESSVQQLALRHALAGLQKLLLGPALYLLVPSHKVEEGSTFPSQLDHYKAYQVLEGQLVDKNVALADQIDKQDRVEVTKPALFCVPVAKTVNDKTSRIVNAKAHLTFYDITPRRHRVRKTSKDQFGEHQLVLATSVFLGVPTLKLDWGVVG